MASRCEGDLQVTKNLSCASFTIPPGFMLPVAKAQHRNVKTYQQAAGADVAAATAYVHTAAVDGTLSGVDIFVDTVPAGGDKHFTVDVKKSTGGGAFATVLSSTVDITTSSTTRSVTAAVIASGDYSAGDTFQVVVAVAGSTGTQAQGVLVTLTFDEEAA